MENTTNRELVLNGYIAGIKAILPTDVDVYYLSTQMTSGVNMNNAARSAGYASVKDFKTDPKNKDTVAKVLKENIAFSNDNLHKLRANGRFIITPTTLNAPGFTQDDYAWFWRAVINEFKPTLILSPDWEHSTGSRYEIMDGINAGCSFELLNGEPITISEIKHIMNNTELVK